MIHSKSLTYGHLNATARRLKMRDTQLLSRMVHALYLVEQLAVYGLSFMFKGGTCLSLLVNRIDRLSIDVDIEVSQAVSLEAIDSVLTSICHSGTVFTDWELQNRQNDRNESRHYKVFYLPILAVSHSNQEHILLDVVWTTSEHPCTVEHELIHDALLIDGPPVRIVTPTIEGLLGDKLTACAPLTVGVPITMRSRTGMGRTHNKHLEMIKQLFDVNVLIPRAVDWESVRRAYARTLDVQRQVFGQDYSNEQVTHDLCRRALAMFNVLSTSYPPDLEFAHSPGHKSLRNYLVAPGDFLFEHVKMAALRAAYVAHCMQTGESPTPESQVGTSSTPDNWTTKQITRGLSKTLRPEAVTLVSALLDAGSYR